MKRNPARKVMVQLEHAEGIASVLLPVNNQGRLPTLLIDPVDMAGRPVPGRWITRDERPLEAIYERVEQQAGPLPTTDSDESHELHTRDAVA